MNKIELLLTKNPALTKEIWIFTRQVTFCIARYLLVWVCNITAIEGVLEIRGAGQKLFIILPYYRLFLFEFSQKKS